MAEDCVKIFFVSVRVRGEERRESSCLQFEVLGFVGALCVL